MMRIRSDRTPRPRRGIVLFLAVLAVLISVSPRAFAQEDAGIIGVVTDESGAVLPGVTVTVTSSALQVVAAILPPRLVEFSASYSF
jgi:hypothetical protein